MIRVLLLLLCLIAINADARKPAPIVYGPILPLTASAWSKITGGGVALYNNTEGLYFFFPVEPNTSCAASLSCGSMKYLYTTRVPKVIQGRLVIRMSVAVTSGTPAFEFFTNTNNTGSTPASVRVLIWARNNSYADGDRWWSRNFSFPLAPGTMTLIVPLTPDQWSGVQGEMANQDATTLSWWNRSLQNVSSLGITCGGGSFYGHGVYVTGGAAKFTLQSYEVQP